MSRNRNRNIIWHHDVIHMLMGNIRWHFHWHRCRMLKVCLRHLLHLLHLLHLIRIHLLILVERLLRLLVHCSMGIVEWKIWMDHQVWICHRHMHTVVGPGNFLCFFFPTGEVKRQVLKRRPKTYVAPKSVMTISIGSSST